MPMAVGTAVAVKQLPWLLFAIVSGAVVDQIDRRRLIILIGLSRGNFSDGSRQADLINWTPLITKITVSTTKIRTGTAATIIGSSYGIHSAHRTVKKAIRKEPDGDKACHGTDEKAAFDGRLRS
jgi:hypothetical protein